MRLRVTVRPDENSYTVDLADTADGIINKGEIYCSIVWSNIRALYGIIISIRIRKPFIGSSGSAANLYRISVTDTTNRCWCRDRNIKNIGRQD